MIQEIYTNRLDIPSRFVALETTLPAFGPSHSFLPTEVGHDVSSGRCFFITP